ncbi:MAG: hypothetical protein J0L97_07945 [Alphaproteobacteria bacterium]|nr:hypothetical protein [Alphaproteobacteria bacterium]
MQYGRTRKKKTVMPWGIAEAGEASRNMLAWIAFGAQAPQVAVEGGAVRHDVSLDGFVRHFPRDDEQGPRS